jgi:hypothetical protein
MFFPGISALIVRRLISKERLKDSVMRFGSWKAYLQFSLLIPFLYIIIYAITGLFYQPDFTLKIFLAQTKSTHNLRYNLGTLASAFYISS